MMISIKALRRAALLCAIIGTDARAQTRPLLNIPGDLKSWESYFDYGVKVLREAPLEAEIAFDWASRLDPTRAEPLFAKYAATFLRLPHPLTIRYLSGEAETLRDTSVQSADSARAMALLRNPFVHRGLEAVMYDRLPGNFSDSRDTRAWLAYSTGDFARALSLYTRSIDRAGARARWERYDRALVYAAMGDRRRTLEDLRMLLELVRADEEKATVTFYRSKHFLLHMIGNLELAGRNLPGARTAFQEALLEDASFAYGHVGLAHVARAEQKHADAAESLTSALDLAPNDGTVWNFLAMTRFSQSQYEAAATAAARAAALLPLWPSPVYIMAQARERQGRQTEARELYTKFVAMAPANDAQARAVRQRLGLAAP